MIARTIGVRSAPTAGELLGIPDGPVAPVSLGGEYAVEPAPGEPPDGGGLPADDELAPGLAERGADTGAVGEAVGDGVALGPGVGGRSNWAVVFVT